MTKFKCCICGKEVDEWGNNPWPVSDKPDDLCCDDCNSNVVVPHRIEDMMKQKGRLA